MEFKSLQAVLDMAKKKPAADGPTYAPEMTYIVVSKKEPNGSGQRLGILRGATLKYSPFKVLFST